MQAKILDTLRQWTDDLYIIVSSHLITKRSSHCWLKLLMTD